MIEKRTKKETERDLIKIYGIIEWNKLSDKIKSSMVEKMNEIANKEIEELQDIEIKVDNKRESYWLLYLGIILGILGNMIANIIDRNISHGYLYNFSIIITFIVFTLLVIKYLNFEINNEFNKSNMYKFLVKNAKEIKNRKKSKTKNNDI